MDLSITVQRQDFDAKFQQDGVTPHILQDLSNSLDKYYPGKWINCNGHKKWLPSSPDLSRLFFMSRLFVKDIMHALPMLSNVEGLKIRISQAMLRVHEEILDSTWAEMEYLWDICYEWRAY